MARESSRRGVPPKPVRRSQKRFRSQTAASSSARAAFRFSKPARVSPSTRILSGSSSSPEANLPFAWFDSQDDRSDRAAQWTDADHVDVVACVARRRPVQRRARKRRGIDSRYVERRDAAIAGDHIACQPLVKAGRAIDQIVVREAQQRFGTVAREEAGWVGAPIRVKPTDAPEGSRLVVREIAAPRLRRRDDLKEETDMSREEPRPVAHFLQRDDTV